MDIDSILEGVDVTRALKDENYRTSLTTAQQAVLPAQLSQDELSDEQLDDVAGGVCTPSYWCVPDGV